MKKQQRGWEETLQNVPINRASFNDASSNGCDTFGAHIATTLLTDLSEEERRRLAEHIHVCSACAARVQEYQFIEEFASHIPTYDLFGDQVWLRSKKQQTQTIQRIPRTQSGTRERRAKRGTIKSRITVALLGALCLTLLLVGAFTGENNMLLIGIGLGSATLATATLSKGAK